MILAVACSLLACAGLEAQVPRIALPERRDTMTVAIEGQVIGRGITTWTTVGLEHLQVYVWTSALDGESVTDSLFSDPYTLLPVREVRVTGDTTILVHYGRDSLFISRIVGTETSTSHAPAPAVEMFSSASIYMVAATLPLRRGSKRSVLGFYAPPSRLGAQWFVLVVEERVALRGRPAWRVAANSRTGSTTLWIDEATRAVLQMDVREGETRVTFRR